MKIGLNEPKIWISLLPRYTNVLETRLIAYGALYVKICPVLGVKVYKSFSCGVLKDQPSLYNIGPAAEVEFRVLFQVLI